MIKDITSKVEFENCASEILTLAYSERSKIIKVFDYDFEFVATKKYVDALHNFFINSHKNKIYAVLYDDQKMRKDMPRLFSEFQKFSHNCEFYNLQKNRDKLEDAFTIIDNKHLLFRPNRQVLKGALYINEPEYVNVYNQRFDELIEASERVSLFTLGL